MSRYERRCGICVIGQKGVPKHWAERCPKTFETEKQPDKFQLSFWQKPKSFNYNKCVKLYDYCKFYVFFYTTPYISTGNKNTMKPLGQIFINKKL